MNSRVLVTLLVASGILQSVQASRSEGFPSQPIRIIVPYTPGGLPDVVARIVGAELQDRLRQSVVVENKPGGAGSIAVSTLLRAPADGHTLMITDGSTITVNPLLFRSSTYGPADVAAVSLIGRSPLFLAANTNVPVSTFRDFVAYVKANPGKVNYGSSGLGSPHHISMEFLKSALGLEMTHVPFRGSGPSMQGLLGGHIDVLFAAYPSLSGAVSEKQVKILATNGAAVSPMADVPPIATMIPGFDMSIMVGVFVRAGTTQEIIKKIEAEIHTTLKQPSVHEKLARAGLEVAVDGSEPFGRFLAAETASVRKVIADAGIKAQ